MHDVIVIGGGVIGLSIAWELAGQGADVAVLEQSDFGREASWAGAGILPPGRLEGAKTPEARLRALSHSLWPDWAETLGTETGIDPGYRLCGGLEVRTGTEANDLSQEIAEWRSEGVESEFLSAESLRSVEPKLSPKVVDGYRLRELGQVRNPRLLKALVAGCGARGVRLHRGTPVVGFDRRETHVVGVKTAADVIRAGRYCVAGGAWSRTLIAELKPGAEFEVEPVRGQIVLLSQLPRLFFHVIQQGPRYLVPRDDGLVLVGSTEEHVGFDKRNTASAVRELVAFGTSLVPDLADARFERAWAGLRPGSGDGLPYLGSVPGCENVFVAAGHFRGGLHLLPQQPG